MDYKQFQKKNILAKPPATLVHSEEESTANIHINVPSTMTTNETNIKLYPTFNFHSVICDKCMMKHAGVASVQSTPRNLKTWQHRNVKRKDLLKMDICKLVDEVKMIADDILTKKKKWIVVNDGASVKLTTELIKINEQLAGYIDVNRNREDMKGKMRELKIKNNSNAKDEFVELVDKNKKLPHKIKKEQQEIDLILAEKVKHEEKIELMQPKIVKTEEEKNENEQENLINMGNGKFFFDQRMQNYFKIITVEQKDKNKDEMKKFETDSKAIQFEQTIKYNSVTKEIYERITSFENKLDETIKAQNDLEKFIKENRELIDLESLKKKAMESIKRYHELFQDRIKSMS